MPTAATTSGKLIGDAHRFDGRFAIDAETDDALDARVAARSSTAGRSLRKRSSKRWAWVSMSMSW